MAEKHSHRSGSLKQSNKKNKRSKSSKRARNRALGGRVGESGRHGLASSKGVAAHAKAVRRLQSQQRRAEQKKRNTDERRQAGVLSSSSLSSKVGLARLVGIISLSESTGIEEDLREWMLSIAQDVNRTNNNNNNNGRNSTVTAHFAAHKKNGNLTFLTNSTAFAPHYFEKYQRDDALLMAALDLCRVCDLVLFVVQNDQQQMQSKHYQHNDDDDSLMDVQMDETDTASKATRDTKRSTATSSSSSWDHLISTRGDAILSAVKAQGLPTPITILAHTTSQQSSTFDNVDQMDFDAQTIQTTKSGRRSQHKQYLELKKFITRFATTEFGTHQNKVMQVQFTTTNHESSKHPPLSVIMDNHPDHSNPNSATVTNNQPSLTTAASIATATATQATGSSSLSSTPHALVRTLCTMSASPSKWISLLPRPYLVTDSFQYEASQKELKLVGHVRSGTAGDNQHSAPFSIHSLIHVANMGTFACRAARIIPKPSITKKVAKDNNANQDNDWMVANPELRENLDMFATPNALEGEQNLIGFDPNMNDDDEDDNDQDEEAPVLRPAGWSEYQSSWLDAVPIKNKDDNNSMNDDDDDDAYDYGELGAALNQKSKNNDDDDVILDISKEERLALIKERRHDEQEELEFPDEVEVRHEEGQLARDRFARYRALKSFRASRWDPKENLPDSYANLYHLSNFGTTQRHVLNRQQDLASASAIHRAGLLPPAAPNNDAPMKDNESDDDDDEKEWLDGCIPAGSYIEVILEHVSLKAFQRISPSGILAAVGLLPHENKVSVLHMNLSQTNACTSTHGSKNNNNEEGDGDEEKHLPVKSKDILTFCCGWRTWKARPVFSQFNLNSDKHKFERFLPTGGAFFAASVFGPITFTPCPVLVFREQQQQSTNSGGQTGFPKRQLVAVGSIHSANADRIIVKRIILTGYPVRVHKRTATVKYMFYNPEDVKWFKPAGLTTKHGLAGNIVESVGDHGTMKCLFNAPIKQHDTVCLTLYKRIYPKYANTRSSSGNEELTVRSEVAKEALLVL